jgi:hemin uptake protein HemP
VTKLGPAWGRGAPPVPSSPDGPLRAALPPTRAIDSRELLDGARELCIEHLGEIYRLRVTRQNKLILTK